MQPGSPAQRLGHRVNRRTRSSTRRQRLALAVAGWAGTVVHIAQAQEWTWSGAGDGVNWNSGSNWVGGATPGYGTLIFSTTGAGSLNQNLGSPLSMHRIDFTGTAGYTLGGSQVRFFDFGGQQARIENQSSVAQAISFDIDFAASVGNHWAELNPVNADLRVGTVSVTGSVVNSLQVFGSSGFTLTFGGVLSGTSKELVINGASNVAFEAANTYSGDTFINAGTLQFRAGGSAASSTIRVGATSGTGPATLSLVNATGGQTIGNTIVVRPGSSGVKTIKSTNTSGTNTYSGNIFLDADVTVSSDNAGGQLTLSGTTIDLKNQTMTITGAGNTLVSGTLQNSAGSGKLIKSGSGVATLSAVNSYGGATTINGGVLSIAADSRLGTAPGSATAGHLTLNGGTLRHTSSSIGGTNSFLAANRGIAIGPAGGTLEVAVSTAVLTYDNGQITGSGNTLTKSGPGTLRLVTPTAVTFSKLIVTGGSYQGGLDSHYGAVPGSFLADAITLDGGALGATAGISFSANRGIRLGAAGGSYNAASTGTFNAVISGTSGGTFTKAGTGGLVLTAVNTYDGPTVLNAGSLSINGTSTVGNGSGTIVFSGGSFTLLNTRTSLASALPNPIRMLADATFASTTSLTTGTRVLPLGASSIDASTGNLAIRNPGSAGTTFALRFTGGGWIFSRPIAIGNIGDTGSSQLQFFSQTPTAEQTFSGVISGAGSVVRSSFSSGAGADTILSGANTYTGGTTLAGGFIGFGIDSVGTPPTITSGPIGTGSLLINDDASVGFYASGGSRIVGNAINFGTVVNTTIKGSNDLTLSGAVSLGPSTRTLTVTNTADTTFSGVIGSTGGGLTKAGPGRLILSNANTYSGGTTVAGGTLFASNTTGSATGTGSVNVNATATLGGNGFISGAVNINAGGTLSPGLSIGDLDTGSLTFADSTSKYLVEINADAPAVDRTVVTGGVVLNGATLQLSFVTITPGIHATPQTFVLIDNDAADLVSGTFGGVTAPPWASVLLNYAYSGTDSTGYSGDGNDVAITITYTPEPSTMVGVVGLAGLLARRRRR